MISGSNRSGRVDITWPSLMNEAPSAVMLWRRIQPRRWARARWRAGPTNRKMPRRPRHRAGRTHHDEDEPEEVENVTRPAQHYPTMVPRNAGRLATLLTAVAK